jgi:hypothetical protein
MEYSYYYCDREKKRKKRRIRIQSIVIELKNKRMGNGMMIGKMMKCSSSIEKKKKSWRKVENVEILENFE